VPKLEDIVKDALGAVAFVCVFAPGFVAMKTYDWRFLANPRKVQDLLYELIGYSAVTYTLASPLLVLLAWAWPSLDRNWQAIGLAVAMLFVLAALPFGLGFAVAALQKNAEANGNVFISSVKTPWDYAFKNRRKNVLLQVCLRHGNQIIVGEPGSVSDYPFDREVFLQNIWKSDADGNPICELKSSRGMLLFGPDILWVRFVAMPP